MKYDPSLIKKEIVIIDGKKVPLYKCPTGMQGRNPVTTYSSEYNEETYVSEENKIENPELLRELDEYINEGISPDSDEILSIKEDIEKEHFKKLLDPINEVEFEEL